MRKDEAIELVARLVGATATILHWHYRGNNRRKRVPDCHALAERQSALEILNLLCPGEHFSDRDLAVAVHDCPGVGLTDAGSA